jgi:CRISPR/Cas system-associated exonuclease Cas4 (RecB family)
VIEKLNRDHYLIRELVASYRDEWQRGSGQRDHLPRKGFYISDVSKGDRHIYYLFRNPEKKNTLTDKTLILFSNGNILHEDIQARLRSRKAIDSSRDIEYGLEDFEIDTTGRLDCFAAEFRFVPEANGLVVTEIKTKNPYNFDIEEPTQGEIDQGLWYIFRAREAKSLKERNILDYGYILYMDRAAISDPLPLALWKFDYEQERVDGIRERFRKLKIAIETEQIPQRCAERDSTDCAYCRFENFCWEGIPRPTAPVFVADEAVELPEQELVESMAARFLELKDKEKEAKEGLKLAYGILMKYFKATGLEQITANGRQIVHGFQAETEFDEAYLLAHLAPELWPQIATPSVTRFREAVKAGLVDPEIFERAKRVSYSERLRIKNLKGGLNADSRSE